MNISYDNSVDALYIKLKEGEFKENKEVREGVILDIGMHDELLGIEIREASTRFDVKRDLAEVTFQVPLMREKVAA